jgi:hypothetical protein
MVTGAWTMSPAEEPRRLAKQSLGKSIAQKCGRVLGLRTPTKEPLISVREPTEEPVYMLNAGALAEHDFECVKGKISRSNSCLSGSTSDSRSPSKQSEVSLPGSVESDDEDESLYHDPCYQQAELKRIAKQLGQKADFGKASYQVIRNVFLAVDIDGDGRLSASEVASFCNHFGMSESVASRFYAFMDKDEHGNASWQKFMAVFAPVFKEVSAEPPCYATSRLCLPRGQRW